MWLATLRDVNGKNGQVLSSLEAEARIRSTDDDCLTSQVC